MNETLIINFIRNIQDFIKFHKSYEIRDQNGNEPKNRKMFPP